MLDYQRRSDAEPRRRFWPDRDGWKELTTSFVAHAIIEPLLIIGALWVWFRYFRG